MPLSPKQRRVFFPLAQKAYRADYSQSSDESYPSFNDWRRDKLEELTGHRSTNELPGPPVPKHTFDRIMMALALIACDDYWMLRIAGNDQRTLRHEIERYLLDLSFLESRIIEWSYVQGICHHAHDLVDVDDPAADPDKLLKILQMLDVHVRRLCRRRNLRPCKLPTRHPAPRSQAA